MASSYQANLVIEIPNITECYINSHVFTCHNWVSTMLIKIEVTLLGCSMIGQIVFNSRGLRANPNVPGKLGMKLAILACRKTEVYRRAQRLLPSAWFWHGDQMYCGSRSKTKGSLDKRQLAIWWQPGLQFTCARFRRNSLFPWCTDGRCGTVYMYSSYVGWRLTSLHQ